MPVKKVIIPSLYKPRSTDTASVSLAGDDDASDGASVVVVLVVVVRIGLIAGCGGGRA